MVLILCAQYCLQTDPLIDYECKLLSQKDIYQYSNHEKNNFFIPHNSKEINAI